MSIIITRKGLCYEKIYVFYNSFNSLNGCAQVNNINNNSLELNELNYDDIKDKLIRFHVIANSDTEEDQNLKLKVRDKVVEALSEKLKGVESCE